MSRTATDRDLLLTCLQDLLAGAQAFAERYPPVADQADDHELRDQLRKLTDHASERAKRLNEIAGAAGGPENLWMSGILDDAGRDVETITKGRHLDLALIGGVRKALVADLVSHETAIALAKTIGDGTVTEKLEEGRKELDQFDKTLAALLATIAGSDAHH